MFTLSAECTLCSSHQPVVDGDPAPPLHGHNFRVVVVVEGDELSPCGFLMRPGRLRRALWEVAEPFDHRHLEDLAPFAGPDGLPTSPAYLARVLGELLVSKLAGDAVRLRRLEVWPTHRRCVAWEPRS